MSAFKNFYYIIYFINLIIFSRCDENNTSTEREARANGYMIKLYSGSKTDPVLCPREGFLADPVDCSVFYRCIRSFSDKYTVYKFKCGPGTVYDPETEICNHAGNTRRTECGGTPNDRNIENEISAHELPTPITTKLPVILDNIESQNYVTANKYPGFVSHKDTFTNYPMSPTDINLVSTESSYSNPFASTMRPANEINSLAPTLMTTVTEKTTTPRDILLLENKQKGDECTKDGFMGDSQNCRKFYRCVNNNHRGFLRYEFLCSDLTIWDDDLQSCNHPWAVRRRRCGSAGDIFAISNYPDTSVANLPELSYDDKYLDLQKEPVNNKISQNETQIINNSIYTTKPIKENVYINSQVTSSPVTKYQTTPSYTSKTPIPTYSNYRPDKYEPQINYTDRIPITGDIFKDQIKQNIVGNDCSENGFMGDANDCRKFYRCVGNGRGKFLKYEFTCSEGTVWDSNLDSCNYAWAVKECGGRRQSASDISKNLSSTLSPSKPAEITTEVNSLNSNDYTVTSTLVPIDKIYYSNNCVTNGIFGESHDCRIFFKCVDNGGRNFVKYVYKCNEGMFWNSTSQLCETDTSNSCGKTVENNTPFNINKTSDSISTASILQLTTDKNENIINFESEYLNSNYMPIKMHTSTKRSINKNTVCQMSGFFGDEYDCKTFYRCVDDGHGNFIQHSFSCGEGTVWDSSIEACNHAWAVKNCGGMSSTSKADLIHPTTTSTTSYYKQENHGYNNIESNKIIHSTIRDITTSKTTHETLKTTRSVPKNECSQAGFRGDDNNCSKFYRCVDDGKGSYIQYEFSCGDGTVWDPKIEACNHKWAVENCNIEENNNIDDESQKIPISTSKTTKAYQTTTSIAVTSSSQSTILSSTQSVTSVCKSEGFHFDDSDCRKFYRCVDDGRGAYIKYEFTCSDGTAWNREVKACDHLENTSCYNNDTKIESTTAISQKKSTKTAPKNEILFSDDKNPCESEGFYANKDDCTKFYRCVDNGKGGYVKYDFNCGEGTVWVQDNQICEHSTGITNCSITSTVTESSSVNKYSSTMYSTTKITTIATTTQKQSKENYDSECSSEGFYPHESNCQKFYRCVSEGNGKYTKYDFTCGEGTAWDTNIQTCNHKNEVKRCQIEIISQKPEESLPLQDEQVESNLDNNVDTTKYSSSTTKSTKPSSTENYKTTTTTMKATSSTDSTKPTREDVCKEEGYFGSSSNCKNFYRCVSNQDGDFTKYDFTCGEGTIWDQNILGCNHPENVLNASCKSSSNNEEVMTSTTSKPDTSKGPESTSSSSNTQSSSTQPSISETTASSGESDNSHSNNDTFTCTEAGFFANPNDCKKFYRCVDWDNKGERFSIFHFECGEGTAWDQSLLTCNHEYAVNCSKQQSENTTEENSTTTEMSTTETSTQPSTTTKRSTTQSSTTSSTEKPTTQKTTTQQTTTQKTTTQKTTTQKTTTQETTTQEVTTQEATTQQTTTQKLTTPESTTQKSTTTTSKQSTTTEPATEETTTTSTSSTTETPTSPTNSSQETTTEQSTTTTTEQANSTTTQSSEQSTQTDKTTTQDSSTESTTTEAQTESTTESSANKNCPQTSEGEYLFVCPTSFRRHPKYCNLFYQCTEDDDTHESKIATFHCPNNTIYDESKVQCVEEKKADKKCDGEIAARRRVKRLGYNYKEPITVGKEKIACKMPGYYLFEKNEECSAAFLKCESTNKGKVKGYVYQCPEGYLYWSISRRCEPIRKIKDCKHSSFDWSGRNELPIEKLNVAP